MVTTLVRRPRTKPPVRLPDRSEYDGRLNDSIMELHYKNPSWRFQRYAPGAAGYQYGGYVTEWRRSFAEHLQCFIGELWGYGSGTVPDILGMVETTLAHFGMQIRRLPDSPDGMTLYGRPFGLTLYLSSDSTRVNAGAREFARGVFDQQGKRLSYAIVGPQ